ncbi:MAG: hypothetical protein HYV41_02780 [Candidatus Magasanikbacteria bacterium]|nr:hypothetical protein [Candidatus Magasanikbacteria bacterium]
MSELPRGTHNPGVQRAGEIRERRKKIEKDRQYKKDQDEYTEDGDNDKKETQEAPRHEDKESNREVNPEVIYRKKR